MAPACLLFASWSSWSDFLQPDALRCVLLLQAHVDALRVRGGEILADVIGPDGELAMAAIDQHRQLDASRPAEGGYGIHGCAAGPAGEEDVVREDERFFLQRIRQFRGA